MSKKKGRSLIALFSVFIMLMQIVLPVYAESLTLTVTVNDPEHAIVTIYDDANNVVMTEPGTIPMPDTSDIWIEAKATEGYRVADLVVNGNSDRQVAVHGLWIGYNTNGSRDVQVTVEPIPATLPTVSGATMDVAVENGGELYIYTAGATFTNGTEEPYAARFVWYAGESENGPWTMFYDNENTLYYEPGGWTERYIAGKWLMVEVFGAPGYSVANGSVQSEPVFVPIIGAGGEGGNTGCQHELEFVHPADYTVCMGGATEDVYVCTLCGIFCNADGSELTWIDGTGQHALEYRHEADYVPCRGGFTTAVYECTICGYLYNVDGGELICENGTGEHRFTELLDPNYTECGGGFKEPFYHCELCNSPWVDPFTQPEWYEGTGQHQFGELNAPDWTPQWGGFQVPFYICELCEQPYDEYGNNPEWFPGTEQPDDYCAFIVEADENVTVTLRSNGEVLYSGVGSFADAFPADTFVSMSLQPAEGYRIADVNYIATDSNGAVVSYGNARGVVVHSGVTGFWISYNYTMTVEVEPIPETLPTVSGVRVDMPYAWEVDGVTYYSYNAVATFTNGTEEDYAANVSWQFLDDNGEWIDFLGSYSTGVSTDLTPDIYEWYGYDIAGKQVRVEAIGLENYSIGGPVYSESFIWGELPEGVEPPYIDGGDWPVIQPDQESVAFTLNLPEQVTARPSTVIDGNWVDIEPCGSVDVRMPLDSEIILWLDVAEGYRIADVLVTRGEESWSSRPIFIQGSHSGCLYELSDDITIEVLVEPIPATFPLITGVVLEGANWGEDGKEYFWREAYVQLNGSSDPAADAVINWQYYNETTGSWVTFVYNERIYDSTWTANGEDVEWWGVSLAGKQIRCEAIGLENYSVGSAYSEVITVPNYGDLPELQPLNLRVEGENLVWNAVDGATGYELSFYTPVYGQVFYSQPETSISLFVLGQNLGNGIHNITVRANDGRSNTETIQVTIDYPALPPLSGVHLDGQILRWDAVPEVEMRYAVAVYAADGSTVYEGWVYTNEANLTGLLTDGETYSVIIMAREVSDQYLASSIKAGFTYTADQGKPSVGVTVRFDQTGATVETDEGEKQVMAEQLHPLTPQEADVLNNVIALKSEEGYVGVAQMELVLRDPETGETEVDTSLGDEPVTIDLKPFFGESLDLTRTDVTYVLLHFSSEAHGSTCPMGMHEHQVAADGTVQMAGLSPVWLMVKEAEADYIPGDITGDGNVNNKDATRLFQYLSGWDVEVVEAALNVNGDDSVNNKDATRLFQYVSNWDVEIY